MRVGSCSRGFTLVELTIVILVLGLLAAIVLPTLRNHTREAQLSATMNDLAAISRAISLYQAEHGQWPSDVAAGVMPPGLEAFLPEGTFDSKPPIGGTYDFTSHWAGTVDCGISIYDPQYDPELWLEIDRRMDNGDLNSGAVVLRQTHYLFFLLDDV